MSKTPTRHLVQDFLAFLVGEGVVMADDDEEEDDRRQNDGDFQCLFELESQSVLGDFAKVLHENDDQFYAERDDEDQVGQGGKGLGPIGHGVRRRDLPGWMCGERRESERGKTWGISGDIYSINGRQDNDSDDSGGGKTQTDR